MTTSSPEATRTGYRRWKDIEAEIQRVLRLPESDWVAGRQHFRNETLVVLLKQIREGSEAIAGPLLDEISRRTIRIASRKAQGLEEEKTERILEEVRFEILKLILTKESSNQSEFLEVGFASAVRRRTINLVQKYKRTRSFRQEREDDDADIPEEAVNGDGERLADPASSIVDSEELVLRGDLLRKAYANVEDPRDLEAAILHYGHGISLKELAREMNTTEQRAKYWARKGIEAMRKVLGPLSCKEKR